VDGLRKCTAINGEHAEYAQIDVIEKPWLNRRVVFVPCVIVQRKTDSSDEEETGTDSIIPASPSNFQKLPIIF
jgi:hypothetical protein